MKGLFCCVCLLLLIVTEGYASTHTSLHMVNKKSTLNYQQGQVNIVIVPEEKNSHFSAKKKVNYKLFIKNGIPENQEGTISYIVKDSEGKEISKKVYDISIPASKKFQTIIEIPQTEQGKFSLSFVVDLNKVKSYFNFNYTFGPYKKEPTVKFSKPVKIDPPIDDDLEGEIKSKLTPANEDGIFIGNDPIIYDVSLENTYDITQAGTIAYSIKDAISGAIMSEKVYDLKMLRHSSRKIQFKMAPPPKPGMYNVELAINTNNYDDTTRHVFGYEIAKIKSPYHKPDDFDDFWKEALGELAMINPEYSVVEDQSQSNNEVTVYRVEMNSLENIRINGWLTIPKLVLKGKKYPVVINYVGYQIKAKPLYSSDFAQFSLNVRGTDVENMTDINPDKHDLLTLNIHDPRKYVYRGIYMDCIRAVDFILAKEEMGFDLSHIALVGGSQGAALSLAVAGLLNKKIKTVIADNPIFCDFHLNMEMQKEIKSESFIIKFINNYLEENKNIITKEEVLNNLCYYEIQNFIPKIECPVLFGVGLLDPLAPASTTIGAFNKLKPSVQKESEIFTFPGLGHEVTRRHDRFKSIWLYEKLAK